MEERIFDLDNRNIEMVKLKEKRELRFLKESDNSMWELSNSIRKTNTWIVGNSEEKERMGAGNLFLKNSWERPTWRITSTYKSPKIIEHLIISIQNDL